MCKPPNVFPVATVDTFYLRKGKIRRDVGGTLGAAWTVFS